MSDIEFQKAVNNLIAKTESVVFEGESKTAEITVDVSEDVKPRKTEGGWQRTRQCACPDDAKTDCRFHSQSEPGWEICPYLVGRDSSTVKTRWLGIYTNPQLIDEDPTEAQDAALEAKLAVR
ncbi:hypothetical protein D3C87_279330 [compost metagenome]